MKKILLFALLVQSGIFLLRAQDPYDAIRQDVRRGAGVFNLYNFDTPPSVKPPKGYKPFYISHYGRHGARMSSLSTSYDTLMKLLTKAHNDGNLTQRGEAFYQKYLPLYPKLKLRGGDLTTRGQKEHHMIAHRMYNNYKSIFKKGINVHARSTNVTRVVMSMYAFLEGLRECCPDISITSSASVADIIPLNPFSSSNPDCSATDVGFANPHAVWMDQLDAFRAKILQPEAFLRNIFKDIKSLKEYDSYDNVEQFFYEVCCSAQCMENQELLWDIFDTEELCHFWEWDNLKYYLSKGPAPHSNGRQWAFIWRTMQDVLDKADTAFKSANPVIDLRFGHDIIIISMMTLLDIKGWTDAVRDDDVKNVWTEYRVPMASNLQFVFYKNRKNDILVKLMLNEVDQKLPIPSATAPYYKWEDFRKYALKRIDVAKDILKNTTPPPKKAHPRARVSSLG